MPCPPDPRDRILSNIFDYAGEIEELRGQATAMRDTLVMLESYGVTPLDPEQTRLLASAAFAVPKTHGYRALQAAESKGEKIKKRYEVLCCRLGTEIARFAHGPRMAALSTREREQVASCLEFHRAHRHGDRETVARVATWQGHYDRAVMAQWLSDKQLMTSRSSLQPRALDKAIARLDPDSRARFDLEVAQLTRAKEDEEQDKRQQQRKYLIAREQRESARRQRESARRQRERACPTRHCEGTLHKKITRENKWINQEMFGPGPEHTVASAACDTCTLYGGWSGTTRFVAPNVRDDPDWSYTAPIHPRLTRFMTRYPQGPATARQRRAMTRLLVALQTQRRACQEARKHVGLRDPRPTHPEETRFEAFAERYRVTETRRCPACKKKALQAQPMVPRHGNPLTPATDVELEREVRCLSCGHVFWD